jgi:hypothetical protein
MVRGAHSKERGLASRSACGGALTFNILDVLCKLKFRYSFVNRYEKISEFA